MTGDADIFDARTLIPRSCTAMLASDSSRDRGNTASDAYSKGSNCFAMLATFATSGIKLAVHGWIRSQDNTIAAMVHMTLAFDLVNIRVPLASDDMVSSMGAVRNSVSPLIAKRTTSAISTYSVQPCKMYLHPSGEPGSS